MKSFFLVLFSFLVPISIFSQKNDAKMEITRAINNYFKAIITYDEELLDSTFALDSKIATVTNNHHISYRNYSYIYWKQFLKKRPASSVDMADYKNEIILIDNEKTSAIVKVRLNWPEIDYIDYLSLLKIDGEWKIVNKIWEFDN